MTEQKQEKRNPNMVFMTIRETCDLLKIKTTTLWKLRHGKEGNFPQPLRINGRPLWVRSEILQWAFKRRDADPSSFSSPSFIHYREKES